MNSVILVGRLTHDPEVKTSQNGKKIARYTLAVDRKGKGENGEKQTDFITCKSFDRAADFAQNWLHKGTKIIVRGRIETGSYTNKDGKKVYTFEIVTEDQEFAESKAASEKDVVETGKPAGGDNFLDISDDAPDGVPFG